MIFLVERELGKQESYLFICVLGLTGFGALYVHVHLFYLLIINRTIYEIQ